MNNPLAPLLNGIGVVIIVIGLILGISIGRATAGPLQSFSWVFAFLIWIGHFAAGMIFIALAEIINQTYEFKRSFLSFSGLFSKTTEDPNAKANELYVKSVISLNRMKSDSETYSDAVSFYNRAKHDIECILSDYMFSDVAVSLMAAEKKISGYELSEFWELDKSILEMVNAEKDPLACALIAVYKIDDAYCKANALSLIASKYGELGQKEPSTKLLLEAVATAKGVHDNYLRAKALTQIAERLAEAGEFTQALEMANAIEENTLRVTALTQIAGKYAEAGQFAKAMQLADTINDQRFKDKALSAIASRYAEVDQLNKAIEIADKIDSEFSKSLALIAVAGKYIELSKYDKSNQMLAIAFKNTEKIIDSSDKIEVLISISSKYNLLDQASRSREILSQTISLAKIIDDAFIKATVLT